MVLDSTTKTTVEGRTGYPPSLCLWSRPSGTPETREVGLGPTRVTYVTTQTDPTRGVVWLEGRPDPVPGLRDNNVRGRGTVSLGGS